MLSTQSFQTRLSQYRQEFLEQKASPTVRFDKIRNLYQSYVRNVDDLTVMEYGTSLIEAERIYDGLKGACKAEHQQLKQMQKTIDDRTLAIEQKLYLGLPDNLTEMDRVIAEQESILEDQQKINQLEDELLEKMRKIDIDHGKKLALIEQTGKEKTPALKQTHEAFYARVNQEEKKVVEKSKIFALIPILLIPLLLDVICSKIGIQKTSESHLIFSHYAFLLSFVILEVFFSSKIKISISDKLSSQSSITLLSSLEQAWSENQESLQKLEKEYGISVRDVRDSLELPQIT